MFLTDIIVLLSIIFQTFPQLRLFFRNCIEDLLLGNVFQHGAVTLTAAGGWKKKEGEPVGSPWLVLI